MHKLINGYTKDSLKKLILTNNTGKQAMYQSVITEDNAGQFFKVGEVVNEYCVYFNTQDGNRCAIGCCIPDSFIEKNKDILTQEIDVKSLVETYPKLEKYMPMDMEGCRKFQGAHDSDKWKTTGLTFHEFLCNWIDENTLEA